MKLEKEISQREFRNESHKLGVNILFSYGWVQSFFVDILKPYGISSQQFNVLRILRGQHPKPASIKLIRERMLDKMSDASRIVEKLRLKGLIIRKISADDRRSCEVMITASGISLLNEIDRKDAVFDNVFSNLSPEEIKSLNNLLDKMRGE